ncbi:MAG: hypothetical protein AMQ22_02042 [Candidatus Methanofastidiosum methylothiophilum]|uniref:Uncharacterized protein n=1 Tax=Candidatus Methanofastidiosum methylothiophilum TaxID=1705564 RepID=A0A150IPL3_9EURY|nr:MAG: hypothetical protein AMQ22_02042 [Candidatus Methanofastidiosum methylthiophilus]
MQTAAIIEIDGKKFVEGNEIIAAWKSATGWAWLATEVSEIRRIEDETGGSIINGKPENDIIYYGLVLGSTEEWGYFSGRELGIDEGVEKIF